jgi:ABC-type transporter Mla subunit MlaD
MNSVSPAKGRKLLVILSVVLLFLGVIAVILWAIPGNRGPFDYMVAGTFATAIALTAIWALSARGAR